MRCLNDLIIKVPGMQRSEISDIPWLQDRTSFVVFDALFIVCQQAVEIWCRFGVISILRRKQLEPQPIAIHHTILAKRNKIQKQFCYRTCSLLGAECRKPIKCPGESSVGVSHTWSQRFLFFMLGPDTCWNQPWNQGSLFGSFFGLCQRTKVNHKKDMEHLYF